MPPKGSSSGRFRSGRISADWLTADWTASSDDVRAALQRAAVQRTYLSSGTHPTAARAKDAGLVQIGLVEDSADAPLDQRTKDPLEPDSRPLVAITALMLAKLRKRGVLA